MSCPELNPAVIGIDSQGDGLMAAKLTLSRTCEGLIHYKTAAGKSPGFLRR